MNKFIVLLPVLFFLGKTHAQISLGAIGDSITQEAKKMYRSEMASWYGTDIFVARVTDYKDKSAGYFSYNAPPYTRCVFYSRGDTPKVVFAVSFDDTYNTATAQVDDKERDFTGYEMQLYAMRKNTEAILHDTLFKSYSNTELNLIPPYRQ